MVALVARGKATRPKWLTVFQCRIELRMQSSINRPLLNRCRVSKKTILTRQFSSQASLFRLTGDKNPIHIDPQWSQMVGKCYCQRCYPVDHRLGRTMPWTGTSSDRFRNWFQRAFFFSLSPHTNSKLLVGYDKPILHGLCTLGFAVRHALRQFADYDGSQFEATKARFVGTIIPGQTIETRLWRSTHQHRIHYECYVKETGSKIISASFVDLKPSELPLPPPPPSPPTSIGHQSTPVFTSPEKSRPTSDTVSQVTIFGIPSLFHLCFS